MLVNRKILFPLLAGLHVALVLAFIFVFNYEQIADSVRYIKVADEFLTLDFKFSTKYNCNSAPGYPFFLALINFFTSHNKYLIGLVQGIIFALSSLYFIKNLTKRINISVFSILCFAGLIFLSPEFIHINGTTLSESLVASCLIFLFGALINEDKTKKEYVIITISSVFMVFAKMEYIPVLVAIIIPYLIYKIEYKTPVVIIGLTGILLFLNGVKNEQTFGIFNPTSFGSGTVIYGGNNLSLDGSWHYNANTYVAPEHREEFDRINVLLSRECCTTQDSMFKAMAVHAWKQDPIDQLLVIPVKTAKMWLLPGNFDIYTDQTDFKRGLLFSTLFDDEIWPWYAKYKHGMYLIVYWISLLISILGLYFKIKTHGLMIFDFALLLTIIGMTALYSVPFYGLPRFHLPVIFLLFYYSIYCFEAINERFNLVKE